MSNVQYIAYLLRLLFLALEQQRGGARNDAEVVTRRTDLIRFMETAPGSIRLDIDNSRIAVLRFMVGQYTADVTPDLEYILKYEVNGTDDVLRKDAIRDALASWLLKEVRR
jgi:hypothetical protein